MSALIETLSGALHRASEDWTWKFSYAPKPGQQRIKIVARNIAQPEICKTMIFTEELCKTLAVQELARHIIQSLQDVSPQTESRKQTTRPNRFKVETPTPDLRTETLESHYLTMRKTYAMKVSDLKEKAIVSQRPNIWLTLLGMSLRNLQIGRK